MAPWHHSVEIRDGLTTDSSMQADGTGAIISHLNPLKSFDFATKGLFPNGLEGRSFLDCACNCGGYSFAAKDRGAGKTFGFDVRDHWIDQAKFIAKNREADSSNMTFQVADLMELGSGEQSFDVTWFSGIFYHLPDPVTGLKYAADRTKELLFLNTACMPYNAEQTEQPALHYKLEGTEQLMSGVHGLSWLPSGPLVLEQILKFLGFPETRIYYWKGAVESAAKKTPVARIGIVAARDAGRLDGLEGLKQPQNLVKPKATSN